MNFEYLQYTKSQSIFFIQKIWKTDQILLYILSAKIIHKTTEINKKSTLQITTLKVIKIN